MNKENFKEKNLNPISFTRDEVLLLSLVIGNEVTNQIFDNDNKVESLNINDLLTLSRIDNELLNLLKED